MTQTTEFIELIEPSGLDTEMTESSLLLLDGLISPGPQLSIAEFKNEFKVIAILDHAEPAIYARKVFVLDLKRRLLPIAVANVLKDGKTVFHCQYVQPQTPN